MTEKILILGGTKEAAALAAALVAIHGESHVITSLAGRTKEPQPVKGQLRIGGFGGSQGLADYIRDNAITRVIDATHPFAQRISDNAVSACAAANVPLEKRSRPPWQKHPDDRWIEVENLAQARDVLPPNAIVLLAIGAQHMAQFSGRSDITTIARTVDGPPQGQPVPVHAWVIGRPSPDWHQEAQMLKAHAITHIVCRNSGGTGAYAKIEAARNLGIDVIIIGR